MDFATALCMTGAWLLAAGALAVMAVLVLRKTQGEDRLLRALERTVGANTGLAFRRPVMVVERLEDNGVRNVGILEPAPMPPSIAPQPPAGPEEPPPPGLEGRDYDDTPERF